MDGTSVSFVSAASSAAGPTSDPDQPRPDTAETVNISSLALLKMLKHGRAGVPMEVMGLMMGEFVDQYTINVVDVFAMPQKGNAVSVESVDSAFQQQMCEMLKQTGRSEPVVGWYHSHPGYGCWLSAVDVSTQRSFETLTDRAIAVVVDPIQSVKGKVVLDAFRSKKFDMTQIRMIERQSTSNVGHTEPPSLAAVRKGLGTDYYNLVISYRLTEAEQKMVLSLTSRTWMDDMALNAFGAHADANLASVTELTKQAVAYARALERGETAGAGERDPKRHFEAAVEALLGRNVLHGLGTSVCGGSFKSS